MEIFIHVDVRKIDKNSKLAIDEYAKRTSPFCKVTIKNYKDISKVSFKSGSKIYIVTPGSDSPTSPGLAKLIENDNLAGISCIEFLIKRPDTSIDADSYNTTEEFNGNTSLFNLSSFSMSPELTAVVLTEQIYRAYTIMNNITYHK